MITPDQKVDPAGTEKQRKTIKEKRLKRASTPPASDLSDKSDRLVRVHEYLEITQNKNIRCLSCGHVFCDAGKNYKDYALKAEVPGKDLGKHYAPDPDFVLYHDFYCPGCKTLLDQDVLPPGDPNLWNIQVKI